jgi:5-methylcytosine-specific restriction endonuclease McrA
MASYDHVVPTSLGGTDEPENLKMAHLLCNTRRGNRVAADA